MAEAQMILLGRRVYVLLGDCPSSSCVVDLPRFGARAGCDETSVKGDLTNAEDEAEAACSDATWATRRTGCAEGAAGRHLVVTCVRVSQIEQLHKGGLQLDLKSRDRAGHPPERRSPDAPA